MQVKWANVIAFALGVFAFVIFLKSHESIAAFLGALRQVGPGYSAQEQTMGLLAFGLIAIVAVAIVKIITQNSDKGGQP